MTETWSYGEAAEPRGFPWPPPEGGSAIGAFGETWKDATFDAKSFFHRLPPGRSVGPALLYYLIIGILAAGVGLFWDATGVFTTPAGQAPVAEASGFGALDPVVAFLLSPLVLLIALGLSAGITHLLLLMLGGARNGFGTTVRVFCYAYSPMLFGVVPVLGAIVGSIWMIVVAIIGLREGHATEGWKAGLAVLLPFILMVGLLIFAIMMLAAAGLMVFGG